MGIDTINPINKYVNGEILMKKRSEEAFYKVAPGSSFDEDFLIRSEEERFEREYYGELEQREARFRRMERESIDFKENKERENDRL